MNIYIYILLVIAGLFLKNKHFDLIAIAFLAYITYITVNVPDYENYQNAYNYISQGHDYSDLGIGWYYLCRLGVVIGLNFRTFKTVIVVVSCLIIRYSVKQFVRNSQSINKFWSLYLIFPALLDCVQFRFFLAEAIFIFAVIFLIRQNTRGYITYGILILLASTIHSSAIFLLLFLSIPFFHRIKSFLVGSIISFSLFLLVARNQVLSIAQRVVNERRITEYFSTGSGMGFFGMIAYSCTLLLFIFLSKRVINLFIPDKHPISKNCKMLCEVFEKLCIIICAIFPLCTYDTNFFRIQRPLWLLLYVVMIIAIENKFKSIELFGKSVDIKQLTIATVLFGNVFYICFFNFGVITSFLL